MTSLVYNIANMKMSRMELGSPEWIKFATAIIEKLGYTELQGIENRYGKPWFMSGRKMPKRVGKIADILTKCNSDNVFAFTIITTITLTKEEAITHANKDGAALSGFIRNRFPNAVWLLTPEVDIKLASDIIADITPDRSWANDLNKNHLVFLVHFHGLLFVPTHSQKDVVYGFLHHRNGKRVKHYSGNRQIRIQNMYTRDGKVDLLTETNNVIGYATKCHYRPPTKLRMLEGYPEWVWVTNKIATNNLLIRTGGSSKFNQRNMGSLNKPTPFSSSDTNLEIKNTSIDSSTIIFDDNKNAIDLNSDGGDRWKPTRIPRIVKFFVSLFRRSAAILRSWMGVLKKPP
ncbi:MAG: hypothetical protein COC12_03425 [Rhodobacteraceae bacterium]|nr:MAG: hypothetical protein COC12_03425 [Paracoccaceae bacterium]